MTIENLSGFSFDQLLKADRARAKEHEEPAHGFTWLARALIPGSLASWINRLLRLHPEYKGNVEAVHVHWLQGKIEITGFRWAKITLTGWTWHLEAPRVVLDVSFKKLLAGTIVSDIDVESPKAWIDFGPAEQSTDARQRVRRDVDQPPSWQSLLTAAMPFQIHRLRVRNGSMQVRYRNKEFVTALIIDEIYGSVKNITNSPQLAKTMMATMECRAQVHPGGRLRWNVEFYPLASCPTFNMDFELQGVDITAYDPAFRRFLNIGVRSGIFDLYAEMVAAEGRFQGYAKPILDHLQVERAGQHGWKNSVEALFAKVAVKLFRNRHADRIATKVNFEGELPTYDVDVMAAVTNFFKNAFHHAFQRRLDYSLAFRRIGKHPSDVEIDYTPKFKTGGALFWQMLQDTWTRWLDDGGPRMGAALSYYTAFSIAPLMIVVIAVAGLALGQQAAQGEMLDQLRGLVGAQSAEAIQSMIEAARQKNHGAWATIIGIATLLLGASGVLSELKTALNKIWRIEESTGLSASLRARVRSFGLIICIGFLLMVSLVVSAAISYVGKYMDVMLPMPLFFVQVVNFFVSLGVVAALFAMLFKWLPDAKVAWKDVAIGAAVTSVLFTIGKTLLGLYLGRGATASSYGTASSVLIILFWVYYSAQILYLGSEFTAVFAAYKGSRSDTHRVRLPA